MARIRFPRRSSLQYWPRKRAQNITARVRNWPSVKDAKPVGFAGYKVGMTHAVMVDAGPNSMMKGQEITVPLTVLECPPLQVIGIRTYTHDAYGDHAKHLVLADKLDKELSRALVLPKKQNTKVDDIKPEMVSDVRVLVATQPKLTTIGKKKPDVFELGLGSTKPEEKLTAAKALLGKEIKIEDVFKEGAHVDTHAITKGKGVQGPVQRHGVDLRSHKSEKTKRGPGSLAGWHGTLNWPVAHQGQTGYHQRTEFNKWLIRISHDPKTINPSSGWKRYGIVKNSYILLKGSIGGPSKRMITFTQPIRPNHKIPTQAPQLTWVGVEA